MARAVGLGSQFRGKLGSMVGYLSKNRRGRYEQSVKAYQPVVSNPQTYAQALARLPLGPTQRFYNALSSVIQRGFEGVAYGEPSKAEFLSINLSNFRGPYCTRDYVYPCPGRFLVSRGSLSGIGILDMVDEVSDPFVTFKVFMPDDNHPSTMAELWQKVLASNSKFYVGEQWTFIGCFQQEEQFHYYVKSWYIDPADDSVNVEFNSVRTSGQFYLQLDAFDDGIEGALVAACMIRSAAYGKTGFLRSTTYMSINPAFPQFLDDTALRAAVASYMAEDADPDDWQDDPTPEYQQVAYLVMVDVTDAIAFFPSFTALAGTQCLGFVTKGGVTGVFYRHHDGLNANLLIDGKADFLYADYNGTSTPVRYNGTYEPAREWSASYGRLL